MEGKAPERKKSAAKASGTSRMNEWAEQWVRTHLELAIDGAVPRKELFTLCKQVSLRDLSTPILKSNFFRVLAEVFPTIRLRRLGGRGNSFYHYTGIRFQASSPFAGVIRKGERKRMSFQHAKPKPSSSSSSSSSSVLPGHALGRTIPVGGRSMQSMSGTNDGEGSTSSHSGEMMAVRGMHPSNMRGSPLGQHPGTVGTLPGNGRLSSLGLGFMIPGLNEEMMQMDMIRHSMLSTSSESARTSLAAESRFSIFPRMQLIPAPSYPESLVAAVPAHLREALPRLFESLSYIYRDLFESLADWTLASFFEMLAPSFSRLLRTFSELVNIREVAMELCAYEERLLVQLRVILVPDEFRENPPLPPMLVRNFVNRYLSAITAVHHDFSLACCVFIPIHLSEVSKFCISLVKSSSLMSAAKSLSQLLEDPESLQQLINSIVSLDFSVIYTNCSWLCENTQAFITKIVGNFLDLLVSKPTTLVFSHWLLRTVEYLQSVPQGDSKLSVSQIVLRWNYFVNCVIMENMFRGQSSDSSTLKKLLVIHCFMQSFFAFMIHYGDAPMGDLTSQLRNVAPNGVSYIPPPAQQTSLPSGTHHSMGAQQMSSQMSGITHHTQSTPPQSAALTGASQSPSQPSQGTSQPQQQQPPMMLSQSQPTLSNVQAQPSSHSPSLSSSITGMSTTNLSSSATVTSSMQQMAQSQSVMAQGSNGPQAYSNPSMVPQRRSGSLPFSGGYDAMQPVSDLYGRNMSFDPYSASRSMERYSFNGTAEMLGGRDNTVASMDMTSLTNAPSTSEYYIARDVLDNRYLSNMMGSYAANSILEPEHPGKNHNLGQDDLSTSLFASLAFSNLT